MQIKEVEKLTGISRQNIRFYERKGLLKPGRDTDNSYRLYSEEDVRRLKEVKLFRKLDMPLDELQKLLEGKLSLEEALRHQRERLEKEQERLGAALDFCRNIKEVQLGDMDVDEYLQRMEREEKSGRRFADIWKDYRRVSHSEMIRDFSFMPEAPCSNPREFVEQLCKYGNDHNLNLVITRESMSPHFEIDGIAYTAYRTSSRFGITVHCQMEHPEDYMPQGMSEGRYKVLRLISFLWLPVLLALLFAVPRIKEPVDCFFLIPLAALLAASFFSRYYMYGRNFKG